jgi:hypothetical protein
MGAAEMAIRKYCEAKEAGLNPKYIFRPYVGLSFDCEEKAVEFYNMHSWEVGFGTKKGNWDKNKDGYHERGGLSETGNFIVTIKESMSVTLKCFS